MAGQKPRPIAMAVSYGATDSVKNSGGVLINMYAEKAPQDAKNPVTLIGSPGQVAFATCGASGTVCHAIEHGQYVYVTTTAGLFRVTNAGVVTQLATFTVLPLARMATNGTHIMIVDGVKALAHTIGGSGVTDITATASFFPSATVAALDSYFVFESVGTGQFFHTELNSTSVDPLSLSTAEAYPDIALAVAAHRRQLWVFGSESIEIFYNFGGTASAFARVDGATIPHGIAGPYAWATNDKGLAYLSAEGVAYLATGLVPEAISTEAIHDAIEGLTLSNATVSGFTQSGHAMFMFNVGTKSFCYDMDTGLWHGLRDETYGRHRAVCLLNAFGKLLMGDAASRQVLELREDAYTNSGSTLIAEVILPPIHADQRKAKHSVFEIELDTGYGGAAGTVVADVDLSDADDWELTTGNGADELQAWGDVETYPVVLLSFSDDDGKTWSDAIEASLGYAGEWLERVQWRRLGSARTRRYRVQILSAVPRRIVSRAWLQVS